MNLILVVDDEETLLTAMEYALVSHGFDVMTAQSGEAALLAIKDRHPDLILLDIMMPGLSGLETLQMLKSHAQFKKIPVILVSAASPLGKQSDYGWADFIQKPFMLTDLIVRVNKQL